MKIGKCDGEVSDHKSVIHVIGGIVVTGKKILIAQRNKGGRHSLKWEFPGGKCEPGEKPEECLKREFQEEFGVDIEVTGYATSIKKDYPDLRLKLDFYFVKYSGGSLSPREHKAIAWVTPEELPDFDLADTDAAVAEYIQSYFNRQHRRHSMRPEHPC
ncbi:MAG: (deoxy)nucleoside triphosphate pyrophosphohydrolase [Spirochaetota bacterium]